MQDSKRITLLSNFIFSKLLLFGIMLLCTKAYPEIILLICTCLLVYLFFRPTIFYDNANLYIKKINTPEAVIPLKNVISLFISPFRNKNGRTTFSIEYIDIDNNNESVSVSFSIYHRSRKISTFISPVKEVNPNVEIV